MDFKRIAKYLVLIAIPVLIIANARKIYQYLTLTPGCYLKEREKDTELHGLVTKKFIDHDDHNFRAVVLGRGFTENKIYFISHQDSLVWEKIRVNDSLFKQKDSLTFYLIRGKKRISIPLNFDCKDH